MIYTVAAFYRFVPVADPAALRERLQPVFAAAGLCGTLLIAPEGINGTLAGSAESIEILLQTLEAEAGLTRDEVKFSTAGEPPFKRLKLRLKREIITFNQPHADPQRAGTPVAPGDWNRLIADPDIVLLDTRNAYETSIGTFDGAIDPRIGSFTEFAAYVRRNLNPRDNRKVAMFCTGGIRCEKASAFMRAEGFENVYQLQGGILKYLEQVPEADSKWRGECYVFDRRIAVGHGLAVGKHTMCFCCGYPLAAADRQHPRYEEGVSCAWCADWSSAEDKARFRARHAQMISGCYSHSR